MLSLQIFFVGVGTLPFLSPMYKPLGVLYIIFQQLLVDVIPWSLLFSVITLSVMITLVGLQQALAALSLSNLFLRPSHN